MTYAKVTGEIVEELSRIAGQANVWTSEEKLRACSRDESTSMIKREEYYMPEVVVAPRDAGEVSLILKLANRRLIPVTPRGGGTGLSGGALPLFGGIVISDERMNKIIEIDGENMTATVEAGVITSEINAAAAEKGLWYAGYPMSLESCHIGGNIAENAGGGNAVKYGVTMRYVLGLEVVTPTGEVLELGGKLMKDVSGFSLKELFVGSEGTLGYITKVILKLLPTLKNRTVLLALFPDTERAIAAVPRIMTGSGVIPTAIEYIDRYSYVEACRFLNEDLPTDGVGAVLLVELDGTNSDALELDADIAGRICSDGGAIEIYVADNATTRERVWAVRRNIDEALRLSDPVQIDEDTVVPVSAIPAFTKGLLEIAEKYGVKVANFGHAGDGNLHPSIMKKEGISLDEWDVLRNRIEMELFLLTSELGGVLSGEHGIGSKRRAFFTELCQPEQLEVMRVIKKALDPNNIMNPGKIFDA